ncbi:MAG: DUF1289 domain-containing protein [Pseudomonadota bacterium]|nr:DUF1289 domain-containing protein [Pseudomonadota bacterium]
MSQGVRDAAVASPCTSVCVIDQVTGLCSGCLRTLDEIAGWIDFSTAEKSAVIAELDIRRYEFGDAIQARMELHAER